MGVFRVVLVSVFDNMHFPFINGYRNVVIAVTVSRIFFGKLKRAFCLPGL